MRLFVAGGSYQDVETGEHFFSVLEGPDDLPVISQDMQTLFPRVRAYGHLYQVCRHAKYVKLACASEQAENYEISAPVLCQVPEHSRRKILRAARHLLRKCDGCE